MDKNILSKILRDSNYSFSTIAPIVQSYKTNLYWDFADWYNYELYDPTVAPDVVVANRLELGKLIPIAGEVIKVLNNGNNQFVVYLVNFDLSLSIVGVENGTVQISTDTIPGVELR